MISGLENQAAQVPVAGDHARGTGSFLTCETVAHTTDSIYNGISVDQVAANAIGDATPLPLAGARHHRRHLRRRLRLGLLLRLHPATSPGSTPTPPTPNSPTPPSSSICLFAGFDETLSLEQIERRRRWRSSVLDNVTAEANALHPRLATSDRAKLDEYLTGVRELEIRIQGEAAACVPRRAPRIEPRLRRHLPRHDRPDGDRPAVRSHPGRDLHDGERRQLPLLRPPSTSPRPTTTCPTTKTIPTRSKSSPRSTPGGRRVRYLLQFPRQRSRSGRRHAARQACASSPPRSRTATGTTTTTCPSSSPAAAAATSPIRVATSRFRAIPPSPTCSWRCSTRRASTRPRSDRTAEKRST